MRNLIYLLLFLPLFIQAQKIHFIEDKYYFLVEDIKERELYDKIQTEHKTKVVNSIAFYLQKISVVENYSEVLTVAIYKDKFGRKVNIILIKTEKNEN